MSKPSDITGSLYKSRKLRQWRSTGLRPEDPGKVATKSVQMRRLAFSSFSFAVTMTLIIAVFGQLLIMSLFQWL